MPWTVAKNAELWELMWVDSRYSTASQGGRVSAACLGSTAETSSAADFRGTQVRRVLGFGEGAWRRLGGAVVERERPPWEAAEAPPWRRGYPGGRGRTTDSRRRSPIPSMVGCGGWSRWTTACARQHSSHTTHTQTPQFEPNLNVVCHSELIFEIILPPTVMGGSRGVVVLGLLLWE